MTSRYNVAWAVAPLIVLVISSCTPTLRHGDSDSFYNHDSLSSEIRNLQSLFPELVTHQVIGQTYEDRDLYVVKITGGNSNTTDKPGLLAIFAEHSAEHDMTALGIGLIQHLTENYGRDQRITDLLDKKVVYIVPMMNPDGVDFDLSGEVEPFTWRKNRRPIGDGVHGVDLNRNWGRNWNLSVSEELAKSLNDKTGPNYAGEEPFSEKETQAVRDFLLSHSNIKIIVDYHSGSGGFIQGNIMYPGRFVRDADFSPLERSRYEEVAGEFARAMSDSSDKRTAFFVNENRDVLLQMKEHFPWYFRPFLPETLPFPPGTSTEWASGELGIMSFGVETQRGTQFFSHVDENLRVLIENQARGFLFLLDSASEMAE